MKLLKQVAIQLAGALATVLIWRRFGLVGVLVVMPVAFAVGYYGAQVKHRWRRR